jgi:hypothetical protein
MSKELTWWIGVLLTKAAWCMAAGNPKHAQRFFEDAASVIKRTDGAAVIYSAHGR